MKTIRTYPKISIINVRGLLLIYLLLCILTIVFSQFFIAEILQEGSIPGPMYLVVFFTIPALLLIFLILYAIRIIRDLLARRVGSKFQLRLMVYFTITVILAAAPVTIITTQFFYEMMRVWRASNTETALESAQYFAMDNYAFHLERLEALANQYDFSPLLYANGQDKSGSALANLRDINRELEAVQDFTAAGEGGWKTAAFIGDAGQKLDSPPSIQAGFITRDIPRDSDRIRYALVPEQGKVRIITYSLGQGFDARLDIIDEEKERVAALELFRVNLKSLLLFYYAVFFFPSLLMTIIIAISFSRKITQPIIELSEATKRVAEGDFSIQILSRRGDELGNLISSFNSMVKDLAASQAALMRSEKINIWQNMAQQLAHEIKNPLTPIRLSAERVLRRWKNDPDTVGEILESSMLSIVQEVESLSTLLTEFRTLSRPTELSHTWIMLGELIEEILEPYKVSYPSMTFNTDHVSPEISVRMDRRHFSQIFTNLIINAIDSMDGRGGIEIRTDLVKKRESRYCRLSIKDTGKGMSGEEGERIFTPYYTTKESGTGLGLPIVERIVNDHGGSIWFNSAPGLGTTFFIDLPAGGSNPPEE